MLPNVETAVKIAKYLGVSVEYLVTGKNPPSKKQTKTEDLHKYHKYAKTIDNLDSLPENERIPIINMINELMIWRKNNLEYENEVLKTLTTEQEKLKNISNAKEGIEILKNNNRIEKAFENLEKTYEKINKNKEYLSLKERYIDSQNKINYTLDSYDKEVTTYNNYKEKKIIITLSKIFHFPNYNYYKK